MSANKKAALISLAFIAAWAVVVILASIYGGHGGQVPS